MEVVELNSQVLVRCKIKPWANPRAVDLSQSTVHGADQSTVDLAAAAAAESLNYSCLS